MKLIRHVRSLLAVPGLYASLTGLSLHAAVYVAPNGKDAAIGTETAPLADLAKAIELARRQPDHAVILTAGTYRLNEPIVLQPEDSGLHLLAAPGAEVILSGGTRIAGWHEVSGKPWWVSRLPAALPMPRQIYVDGVRASRTSGVLPVGLTMNVTGYTASSDTLAHWRHPAALEMLYTGGNPVWGLPTAGIGSWTEPRCPVASIQGAKITMAEPCWTNSTKRVMLPSGARTANLVGPESVGKEPTSIENAYELLGRPGEFYADPSTREIFYTPRTGERLGSANVEAPRLEALLILKGSAAAPIHDVTVRGITFSYAGWQEPSSAEGFSEIQANYRVTGVDGATKQALCTLSPGGTCPFAAWTAEPGNVRALYSDGLRFERDVFTHLGGAGLEISRGAHSDVVEGCVFTDISGNGVQLANVDQPEAPDAEFAVGNRIENNLFYNVGAEFRGGIPIVVGYARQTHIAHNLIENIPYAAISIGWGGWPDKINLPGVANRSAGNVIEKNRITHFMLKLSDGGGIYTQGRTGITLVDGETVAENYLDDQVSSGHAIYTDNGSAMITVRDNVIFSTNFDNWGSRHKDYYDGAKGEANDPLSILRNWWEQGDTDADKLQVQEQGNHLISEASQAPANIREQAGLEQPFQDLLRQSTAKHAPEPPSAATAFVVGSSAYVSWRVPVNDGGASIQRYRVRASDGATTTVEAGDFARLYYAKLQVAPGVPGRTFAVSAINAQGESVPSLPSRTISESTDRTAPGPMDKVNVRVEGTRASIHFAMPKDHAENLIAVVVAVDDLQHLHTFTGSRIVTLEGRHASFFTLDGLAPGKHRFGVAAVSGAGQGEMVWVDPGKDSGS